MLYHPERDILQTPTAAGLDFTDVEFVAADGVRLHGWWIPAPQQRLGHVLLAHGNAGNIGDRIPHAALLTAHGFDVFLLDYRGYGRSAGRPNEQGTYLDGRAARIALLQQSNVDPNRVFYLGESLGGAVVLELALAHPPAGVILTSTFASIREMARSVLPILRAPLVPDAYPSARRIRSLRSPVLILHGTTDELVPVSHAHTLYDAAPQPKALHLIAGVGHNDLIVESGTEWAETIATWARGVEEHS